MVRCSSDWRLALAVAALMLAPLAHGSAETPITLPLPVEVMLGPAPPRPVVADGRVRLLYELRITNFGFRAAELKPLELTRLDIEADGRPLATFTDDALEPLLMSIGAKDPGGKARRLEAGRSVLVFLDLSLPPGQAPPKRLGHRVTVEDPADGRTLTVQGPEAPVVQTPPPVIGPPIRGSGWAALFGLSNPDNHRRSLVVTAGRTFIASRFAIDWVRLGTDGRMYDGDLGSNASYYGYGAEVLAVADGRVVSVRDDIPDNFGDRRNGAVRLTMQTIPGDSVVEEIGPRLYAVYDHLQPCSLRVRTGQQVRSGQVLARLGNSGSTLAPHLHFQLMDGPGHNAAEGVPYELRAFADLGPAPTVRELISGKAWRPAAMPTKRRKEFPLDGAVVSFPAK